MPIYGKYNGKEPSMRANDPAVDGLTEIRELNRLFLTFLRGRLATRGENLGLPRTVAAAIATGSDDLIWRLAQFPQAMFRLDVAAIRRREVTDAAAGDVDSSLSALQLILLVSVRNLCRSSPYSARLYLRLSRDDATTLSTLPVTELPAISSRDDVVRCAYPRIAWMWPELLRSAHPERTHALLLLALQPRVEINPPLLLSR
jgi:hypothetical protein